MRLKPEQLRLYAVTGGRHPGGKTLYEQVEAAIRGGALCVQLRMKDADFDTFLREARAMAGLCRDYGVPLLVNDNVEVALRSGADGAHLGQGDMRPDEARRLLGPDRILGVTAKTVEQAVAAQDAGADYLGSGAVFGTMTKADALPMEMDTLRAICAAVSIPVVAIGGINRDNITRLAGTGVAGAAVVSGIFGVMDIEAECRLLRNMAEEIVR